MRVWRWRRPALSPERPGRRFSGRAISGGSAFRRLEEAAFQVLGFELQDLVPDDELVDGGEGARPAISILVVIVDDQSPAGTKCSPPAGEIAARCFQVMGPVDMDQVRPDVE